MAKTFKNLPTPAAATITKQVSERDFFDLTDDFTSAPTTDEAEIATVNQRQVDTILGNISTPGTTDSDSNTSSIGTTPKKTRATKGGSGHAIQVSNPGNTSKPLNPVPTGNIMPPRDSSSAMEGGEDRDVRQTFILSAGHLEQLRDHVHARRAGGDYNYSQKQALQEALSLLFASATPVAPRPAQARELEQQRRERIQRGRRSGS